MKTTKKLSVIIALTAIVFLSSSCEKNYVCECKRTYTKSNGSVIIEPDGNYTYKDTKLRASNRCNDQEGVGSDLSGEYTRNCELK